MTSSVKGSWISRVDPARTIDPPESKSLSKNREGQETEAVWEVHTSAGRVWVRFPLYYVSADSSEACGPEDMLRSPECQDEGISNCEIRIANFV